MNKIYIKKRIIKQNQKEEEQNLDGWMTQVKANCLTKRRKKRKTERSSEDDDDYEPYSSNIYKTNFSISNFSNNSDNNDYWDTRVTSNSWNFRVSRDDKKLQYYLDMIKRQEMAENKKKARKYNKEFKNTQSSSNPSKKFETPTQENFQGPISICMAKDSDSEIELLAKALRMSNWLQETRASSCSANYTDHPASKCYKDELISCSQSEDPNDSTIDRLRTPTQNSTRYSSIMSIPDEVTYFENFKMSNLVGKIPGTPNSSEECNGHNAHLSKNSKEDYWARLIQLTKQKQASLSLKDKSTQNGECTISMPILSPPPRTKLKKKSIQRVSSNQIRDNKSQEIISICSQEAKDSFTSPTLIQPVFLITRQKKHNKVPEDTVVALKYSAECVKIWNTDAAPADARTQANECDIPLLAPPR